MKNKNMQLQNALLKQKTLANVPKPGFIQSTAQ